MTSKNKTILRILISPLVFLYGIFMLIALTMFPLPVIVVFSIFGLISTPVVYLLKKIGAKVNYSEPVFADKNNNFDNRPILGHFVGSTVYIWGAFYFTYQFIKTGKIDF